MDTLTFIVEMTKALAWPIAVSVLGIAFRSQIRGLLLRMKKGKVGPAEFEFEHRLQELAAANPEVASATEPSSTSAVLRMAAEPRAVVFENWLAIEQELRSLGKKEGVAEVETMPSSILIKKLEAIGKVDALASALFRDMRHLRNNAAHVAVFEPGPEAVEIYINMARKLRNLIRGE